MHKIGAACHCRNIELQIELSRSPEHYHPRACDCDFCSKHGAAFVSDPAGTLTLLIKDARARGSYYQGSQQAELVLCKTCGVFVGALHRANDRLYATLNARTVDAEVSFSSHEIVSPRKLSAVAKSERWEAIWFPTVKIIEASGQAGVE
jgi:hypothetical protein